MTRVPDTEMQGISAQDQKSQHWWSPLYPHSWSALIWSQCFSPCLGNARWTQGSSGKWCYLEGVLGHVSPSHPQNCHTESAQTRLHKDPTHIKLPQHHVRDPPSPRKHQRSKKLWMLPSTPIWFWHTASCPHLFRWQGSHEKGCSTPRSVWKFSSVRFLDPNGLQPQPQPVATTASFSDNRTEP